MGALFGGQGGTQCSEMGSGSWGAGEMTGVGGVMDKQMGSFFLKNDLINVVCAVNAAFFFLASLT